jgi:hypothetical protein
MNALQQETTINERLGISARESITPDAEDATAERLWVNLNEAFYFANKHLDISDIGIYVFVSTKSYLKKLKDKIHDSVDYQRVGGWIDINNRVNGKNIRLIPCLGGHQYLTLFRSNFKPNEKHIIASANTETLGSAVYARESVFNDLVLHHFCKFLTDPESVFDLRASLKLN